MRRAREWPGRIAWQELTARNAGRASALVPFVASVLLIAIVTVVASGSQRVPTQTTPDFPQPVLTPHSLPTVPAAARATPEAQVTPTPRVIRVAQPTPAMRLRSTATPRASAVSSPSVTTTQPTAVALSAASSSGVIPTASWEGVYRPREPLHFGRPWVAVYGDLSVYSRATAAFLLDAAPTGPATLTLTGIDDEWPDRTPIAVEVNGNLVFSGASPFANWDGAATGATTAWTPVDITIAPEHLRAGRNRITVANLSPAVNIGSPPYVLLGDASLQAPGAAVTVLEPEGSST
jgi:hypothetical protein